MTRETHKPLSHGMERWLLEELQVLDHGFVRVVDYMGNDESVVQAARVSYGRGTKGVRDDRTLIRYLMRHRHTTPFEMCEIKLHVKMPIFVARQWIRHRTASVNEVSARYSVMDKEFYMPAFNAMKSQSKSNKQGSDDRLPDEVQDKIRHVLKEDSLNAYAHYEEMMEPSDGSPGLSRELARMNLPSSIYTQWYWKTDLHNLMHFLMLRMDSHAQHEIRSYAWAISRFVRDWVPITWEAFEDYRLEARTFSGPEMRVLRRMMLEIPSFQEDFGMTQREWDEFVADLK